MAFGEVPIEWIELGDFVLAYDAEAGKVIERAVTEVHRGQTGAWITVVTDSGDEIRSTRFHRFWVESEQEWIEAIDLRAGMELRLVSGDCGAVAGVRFELSDAPETTYNLTVDDSHTYFVGRPGVLVHNDGPTPEELLGIKYANKNAQQSAKVIEQALQIERARAGRRALIDAGIKARVDIPSGDPTRPGNLPHAHGDGWAVNVDGTPHDASKNKKAVPEAAKRALRSAGWDC
jgi:hypothetical protein